MNSSFKRAWIKFQFGTQARVRIYQKLARFLSNGVSLGDAIDIMHAHASDEGKHNNKPIAQILREWSRLHIAGKLFPEIINGWVPDNERYIIEGGASSGRLPQALERAAESTLGMQKMRKIVMDGIKKPIILFAAIIGFLAFFAIDVVPKFEDVMPASGWTGAAAQLVSMSKFVQESLIWVILGVVAVFASIYFTLPHWTGMLRKKFDKLPPWSIYKTVMGSSFLLTVSGMLSAGIPVPTILMQIQKTAKPWYAERLNKVFYHTNNGVNLGEALHRTGYEFPDKETVVDLRSYADLGNFDETLSRMGDDWLKESIRKVEAQVGILYSISFGLAACAMLWLASGVFSLTQQISNVAQ